MNHAKPWHRLRKPAVDRPGLPGLEGPHSPDNWRTAWWCTAGFRQTRRKTLLKAIGDAIKGTSGSSGGSGDHATPAAATALSSPTLALTLDAHSLSLVDDILARVNMPVGIDELLLAGLIGLSEFDDILELISDVRDVAASRA